MIAIPKASIRPTTVAKKRRCCENRLFIFIPTSPTAAQSAAKRNASMVFCIRPSPLAEIPSAKAARPMPQAEMEAILKHDIF